MGRKAAAAKPKESKSTRGQQIRRLGLVYEERHRDFIIQALAEMYKPNEVAALTIQEFAVEWRIGDPGRNPADRERFEEIRTWVTTRIRQYSYSKNREGIQQQIQAKREAIRAELEEHYRDANKFARIGDLARIKEMAIKDGQYMAAVRAVQGIREEIEGTRLRIDGKIDHTHRAITPESEIDAELKALLTKLGVRSDRADTFVRTISQTAGQHPDPAEAQPRQVER